MPALSNAKYDPAYAVTALYARLSSDDGMDCESNSISNQKKLLKKYADDNGLKNVRYYVDDGISGTTFEREGFKRMIADIELGDVKTVIVKDLSRLGRNHLLVGYYTENFFPDNNVRFVAIYDNVDSEYGDNEFAPFKNIFNEWFSRDTSRKVRTVVQNKGHSGGIVSTIAPYGYKKDPANKNHWLIDEEAAEVIRKIFELYLDGMGTSHIADYLNEHEIMTPSRYMQEKGLQVRCAVKEKPVMWDGSRVNMIIRRREYCGDVVNFKTTSKSYKNKKKIRVPDEERVIIEGINDAIIDKEIWVRAQEIIAKGRRVPKKREPDIFQSYLYCADCGSKMFLKRPCGKNPKPASYICSGHKVDKNSCSTHFITQAALKELVLKNIQKVIRKANLDKKEFAEELYKQMDREAEKEISDILSDREKLLARYNVLEKFIQKLYEDRALELISDERYFSLSGNYEAEQSEIKRKLAEYQEKINANKNDRQDIDDFVELVTRYSSITEITPEVLSVFVSEIRVHQRKETDKYKEHTIDVIYRGKGFKSTEAKKR